MGNILDMTPEPYTGIEAYLERLGFKYIDSNVLPPYLVSRYIQYDTWVMDDNCNIQAIVKDDKTITISSSIGKRKMSKTLSSEELHDIDKIVIYEDADGQANS